ncbi:uncharacterized protein Hap1MRO34_025651 [Clarias gariepinus]
MDYSPDNQSQNNQSQNNQSESNNPVAEGIESSVSSENITKQCEIEGIKGKPQAQKMSEKEVFVLSGTKYFILLTGNTLKSHEDFIVKLKSKVPSLQEVERVEECDFILVFCPVVSQVGTDTERAVNKINDISGPKPAVLVVLHHTFDPECVVPESNRTVTRENTITVDCLFHEDQGLLTCKRNSEVFNYLEMQINPKTQKTSWEGWNDFIPNILKRRFSTQPSEPPASPNNQNASELKHADDILHDDFKQLEQLRRKIFKTEEKKFVSNEVIIAAELKLVLLARNKSDKTAAKNIILDKEVPATSTTTSTAETENTQLVDGRKVTVVDTPDLFSPGMSLEEFRHIEGPHAFLLIIPVMNSEKTEHKEDKTQVSFFKMENIFGDRCWRNTIIIFSVTDELQKNNIGDFIKSGDQELQELVEKCEKRFHCLNIKERGDCSQVSELLEKVEKMVDCNGAKIYQIIKDMVMETALLKDVQHKMQKSLDKNEQYIKQYEEDLKYLRTGQNSADHIKIMNALKEKCELKREVGEEIKKRYDRIVRMKENREFIRVILPETMQTVWLSLSDEPNKNLDKKNELAQLKEWFSTNMKL